MKAALLLFWFSLPVLAQNAVTTQPQAHKTKQHVITKGDVTIVHDCHKIELDAEDALDQARSESPDGRARLERPKHGTAYDCYTTEKPVYDTLVDMDIHDKLSEEGKKLLQIVRTDNAYFQLSLASEEK
jgi:hypothetical protein